MPIPDTDLHRIRLWCRQIWPEQYWDEVKCEADVAGRLVTIVEVRPAWDGAGADIREVVARLRYTETTGLWSIYWCDHNSEFHEYKRKRPTRNVQSLLDYIGSHKDPIFWG